jgi:hypothetical protein
VDDDRVDEGRDDAGVHDVPRERGALGHRARDNGGRRSSEDVLEEPGRRGIAARVFSCTEEALEKKGRRDAILVDAADEGVAVVVLLSHRGAVESV